MLVVTIVAILSTIVLMAVNPAKRFAETNDAERRNSIGSIRTAVRSYFTANGQFPEPDSGTSARAGWDVSDLAPFISELERSQFLKKVPVDPINDTEFFFAYHRFPAGSFGCDPTKGAFIVLAIRNYEATELRANDHPDQQEGGWACPERDFGDEFAYVYGEFEQE